MVPEESGFSASGLASVTAGEPLAPAEGAEVVVERVVLHHEHDDVLDLRQQVGADPTGGIGPFARPGPVRLPLPPAYLLALDPLPRPRADHLSPPPFSLAHGLHGLLAF